MQCLMHFLPQLKLICGYENYLTHFSNALRVLLKNELFCFNNSNFLRANRTVATQRQRERERSMLKSRLQMLTLQFILDLLQSHGQHGYDRIQINVECIAVYLNSVRFAENALLFFLQKINNKHSFKKKLCEKKTKPCSTYHLTRRNVKRSVQEATEKTRFPYDFNDDDDDDDDENTDDKIFLELRCTRHQTTFLLEHVNF